MISIFITFPEKSNYNSDKLQKIKSNYQLKQSNCNDYIYSILRRQKTIYEKILAEK